MHCGLCHSDLSMIGNHWGVSRYPLVPGHEVIGRVTAVGEGVDPAVIVVAITGGWALAGASSPYTATTMLIGSFGKVSASHVGMIWNRSFTLAGGALLSLWVALLTLI